MKGVPFDNEKLSILLYADDVVLLATSESDFKIIKEGIGFYVAFNSLGHISMR